MSELYRRERIYVDETDDGCECDFIKGHLNTCWRLMPVDRDYEAAEDALDDWLNDDLNDDDERTVYEGAKAIVDAAVEGTQ